MLPSGITNLIIPERALRINIAISVLIEDRPLADNGAQLAQWWHDRLKLNAVHFYAESTFSFDELIHHMYYPLNIRPEQVT